MEIVALIISILAAIISVIALIPSWKTYKKTEFKVHLTCENYEENDKICCNFTFINFSLEPYSILRLDYMLDNQIQFIYTEALLEVLSNTLVPPREFIIFSGIELAFSKEDFACVDNNPKLLKCIKVYTSVRYDPYCIHIRSGLDDSIKRLLPKTETELKE